MSDEGLDNLFKQGLSGRDVKFNMDSWRRMEEMLPPEPKAKGFRFGYVAAFIGFLFVLSASLFIWNTEEGDSLVSEVNSTEQNSVTSTQNDENHESTHALASNKSTASLSDEVFEKGQNKANEENTSKSLNSTSALTNSKVNGTGNGSNGNSSAGSHNSFFSNSSNASTGFFNDVTLADIDKTVGDSEYAEENVSFDANTFTQIDGIKELAILGFDDQSTNILVVDVSDGKLPKVAKNVLGFIGGVNINQSLVDAPQNGISGSEFFGLEYQRYLNGGFTLKTNLLYSARSGVNSRKTYAKKYYDFGSSNSQSTVEAERMVYVEMPVLLNYGVANHNFMVGPSFSYLVSSLNKVTTVYESTTETIPTEEKSVWGYTDGFKKYDFSIVAGYEYALKPKLNLGVRLNYGLIDITDNDYFNDESFDNNVQFRVYVTYSPFQF